MLRMENHLNLVFETELRYVLNVMEERSHLGLDNETADKLKQILVRRITEAEDSLKIRLTSAELRLAPLRTAQLGLSLNRAVRAWSSGAVVKDQPAR